jgi:hypothetical protein
MAMNGALAALAALAHISVAQAGNYYVAANGNDANPGTLTKPFATLPRAQQAARKAAGRDAVTIFIREGTYYLPETLIFTAEDSGTKAAPVLYQAYEKEQAVISGGARLKDLKWEIYRDGIMQAKVPAGFATDQLFVNGERQPLARYPNFDPKERHFNGWAKDAFSPQRAARWKDPAGGFIHALHAAEWGGMDYVITGKGPDNTITYEGGWQNNRPMGMHDIRFVENIFEELDAPGEWFLDAKHSLLYFYPPPGVDLATAIIEAVRLRHLIEFRGTEQGPVRFVSFRGLTFRHAARTFMENKEPLLRSDWTTYRGGAIFYTGSEDCSLEDCFIDQVGGNAVFVNNYNRRVTVRGCHIAKAGANGVAFVGDRDSARVPRDWNDHSQSLASVVENNIMVNNGFHPHVWYKHSEDVFRRNIMFTDHYLPAGGMPATPWGKEMDNNFVHVEGVTLPEPATKLAEQSKRDAHSIVADAMFVDPANGDFRVREGSPALKLGFVNFPMDQFGVQKPELKSVARTPETLKLRRPDRSPKKANVVKSAKHIWQAEVRNISGLGDRSAYGLPDESGVLLLNVPAGTLAAKAGLQKDDVILACNGQPVRTVKDLLELRDRLQVNNSASPSTASRSK